MLRNDAIKVKLTKVGPDLRLALRSLRQHARPAMSLQTAKETYDLVREGHAQPVEIQIRAAADELRSAGWSVEVPEPPAPPEEIDPLAPSYRVAYLPLWAYYDGAGESEDPPVVYFDREEADAARLKGENPDESYLLEVLVPVYAPTAASA